MMRLAALLLGRLSPWLAAAAVFCAHIAPTSASLHWSWNYAGNGIAASGTFVTNDAPDASGFYLITGITGTRNGQTIIALQPAGTPIPGNEPFAVDNLIRPDGPQLTHNGFGYAIADGTYSNPFFADFSSPARYMEFFSAPPFTGGLGTGDSELPISFTATVMAVPEPETWTLLLIGLGMLRRAARRGRPLQ